MACPPVHGDNPRALASGLSYMQGGGGQTWYNFFFAHHEIVRAKVGSGSIETSSDVQETVQLYKIDFLLILR